MNIKKVFVLASIVPMLMACNKQSIAGTYGFRMGKENGTHFGVYLNLKDEKYEHPTIDDYKKFLFTMSVSFPSGDDSSEESEQELQQILDNFKDENGNVGIPGYYRLTDQKDRSGATILKLGVDFNYVLSKFDSLYEEQTGEEAPEIPQETINEINDTKLIESLLYATYKTNEVDIYVPVSIEDAYYQLYWYGVDVVFKLDTGNPDEPFSLDILDVPAHEFGSHPTKEQIAEINKTFADDHSGAFVTTFRDYNALQLGLQRN